MPAQKRRLSNVEATTSTESNVDKKQRYSTLLLFKPSIRTSTRLLNKTNDESRTAVNDVDKPVVTEDQDEAIPRLPKISIKRKINNESHTSEFTIERRQNLNDEVSAKEDDTSDDNSTNEEQEEEQVEEEEEEEGVEDESESDDDEQNLDSESEDEDSDTDNENESDNDESSSDNVDNDNDVDEDEDDNDNDDDDDECETEDVDNNELVYDGVVVNSTEKINENINTKQPPIKIRLKARKISNEKSIENTGENKQNKIETNNSNKNRKLTNEVENTTGENKVKAKRGRKPGYRKYPNNESTKVIKTPRSITSYFLFCQINRPKVAEKNPDLKLRAQQRIVAEMWNKLTDKERLIWRQKAIKMRKKGSKGMISTGVVSQNQIKQTSKSIKAVLKNSLNTTKTEHVDVVNTASSSLIEENQIKTIPLPSKLVNFIEDSKPIDIAAYLSILGESMTNIGTRLKQQEGKLAVQGTSTVLLDSFFCALSAVFCLTNQIEEMNGCPKETLIKILDNISIIMPGP